MHLAVATPMFGGQCTGAFTRSVQGLVRAVANTTITGKITTLYIGNESLIPRARNALVWLFRNMPEGIEPGTHLLFADADQGFRASDIERMIAADKPIICGAVPMKAINWARVAKAVHDGVPPDQLHRYTGYFNIEHEGERRTITSDEPFEIKRGGTGLMLVKREVFEALDPLIEDYVSDAPGDAIPRGTRLNHFFPTEIANDRLMSEDFGFCNAWRALGGKVWCAPWCEITHVGSYEFSGCYKDCFAA